MGMFDTVIYDCPECGGLNDYQSKMGPSVLNYTRVEDAHILVQADLIDEGQEGRLYCEHCGAKIEIPYQILIGKPRVKEDDEY